VEEGVVMASALERGLEITELLAGAEAGLPLHQVADTLGMPRSAAHRMLAELIRAGYVHQFGEFGNYVLGLKLVSTGLRHLAANDLVGLSRPVLAELAKSSGELVRLSILDGADMVWVSTFQGARSGLRYDPDSGGTVRLSCSATGFAWMSSIPEEEALKLILRQEIGPRDKYGPAAPQTINEIRHELNKARADGYAIAIDTHSLGIASVAAPVYDGQDVAGVISVAGPTVRCTQQRLEAVAPTLLEATKEVSSILGFSDGRLYVRA